METSPYIPRTIALELISGLDTVWKKVSDAPDYIVSDHGRVFNVRTNRPVKNRYVPGEGVRVRLIINGHAHGRLVHRLAAEAFVPDKPKRGAIVKYKDGNERNVHASNLYWTTHSESKIKLWKETEYKGKSRAVRINETGQVFKSVKECATFLGSPPQSVGKVLNGKRKTHKGYTYSYI